ncbi:carbohydrate-binding protein [Bifidobacterium goeldii]|uniref:Carbohydrate-binding protein n=1 Tax=Bifidobacterium goeldii TaxID=2306975 RepID=A0A430FND9_9BIFI|nr:Ig-like domain-containing protein [Bifidobacterium goeldii]RSX54336.1 carbohydrate-binding protein [Bifidobacterium goeldii]
MKAFGKSLAAMVAAATLVGGGSVVGTAYAADNTVTVTPNPWYANSFDGWGTSLAWFANATGSYGEESSITKNLGDEKSKKAAVEYGKQLREQFYQSIFGSDGLDLNMARYNVGGGNASDVAYGYPFMRQGAAVPGTWKDDPDGSAGVYGDNVTTKQADKDKLAEAFDPTDDSQYDFSKSAAQDWWITRGATGDNPDITDVEAFSNSAPWFLTNSGYATGGYNSSANNLANPEKFAQYLAKNVEHLESLGVNVDTVEPFNESETSYWGTPGKKASDYTDENDSNIKSQVQLINNYWDKYYADKDKSVTPYSDALKKPQEGMHVNNAQQQDTIKALAKALGSDSDTIIAATDATNSSDFVKSYNAYPQEVKDLIDQYNVHAYSTGSQMLARDIAQADGKKLSMSEVDGSWQSGSYNPYGFDNALGMMSYISSNVTRLQSKDFTFWQVVEDQYNMQMGSNVNPAGENTNWGTVLIDFDCTVAGADGKLYSERRVNNNGGTTDGLQPCTVIANAKYNGVKAITHFIHAGDKIIANNDENNTMTATSTASDGSATQTIVHRNTGTAAQTFVIDLSKYGEIADNASGELYLTTETSDEDKNAGVDAATPEVFAKTSNVKQDAGSVVIDKAAKTATVTVPARSIASIQLTGVSGVAEDAGVQSGHTYQIVGQQSGKAMAAIASGDSALSLAEPAIAADDAKKQVWKFTQVEQAADSERPDLKIYVITNADGKVLVSKDGTNALSDETVEAAKSDPAARWILNTSDGSTYQLLNTAAKRNLDVDGQKTAVGTKIGLWTSATGETPSANQTWTLRDVSPTGQQAIDVQTTVGTEPTMPSTVTLKYAWGEGSATVSGDWDVSKVDVSKAGSYTATATVTDPYGSTFNVTATVYVGSFTVIDPVSATVLADASADDVKTAVESAKVYAHAKTSPAFEIDASKITWDFGDLDAKLAGASAGDSIVVNGTIAASDVVAADAGDTAGNTTLAVKATVYLAKATPENGDDLAAANCSTAKASYTEGSNTVQNTCDGKDNTAWSNWKQEGSGTDTDPWVSYTFDAVHKLHALDFVSYGEATPKSFSVQYLAEDGSTWVDSGVSAEVGDNINRGDVTTVNIDALPSTKGVRLKLTYADNANYYAKIAQVRIYESRQSVTPAADATLGDLRLDGATIDGFAADKTEYKVELPAGTTANPVVQAYAADTAAKVTVSGDGADTSKAGGTATITVTAADGSATKTYTVTFTVKKNDGGSTGGNTGGSTGGSTTPSEPDKPDQTVKTIDVYRLYNPNSGLHHYTTSAYERDVLVEAGWNFEGVAFKQPTKGTPVYRLYNPNNGNHHWTASKAEYDTRVAEGWHGENVAWYQADDGDVTVWRAYNPRNGEHLYTTSEYEYQVVTTQQGWQAEEVAWKTVK